MQKKEIIIIYLQLNRVIVFYVSGTRNTNVDCLQKCPLKAIRKLPYKGDTWKLCSHI